MNRPYKNRTSAIESIVFSLNSVIFKSGDGSSESYGGTSAMTAVAWGVAGDLVQAIIYLKRLGTPGDAEFKTLRPEWREQRVKDAEARVEEAASLLPWACALASASLLPDPSQVVARAASDMPKPQDDEALRKAKLDALDITEEQMVELEKLTAEQAAAVTAARAAVVEDVGSKIEDTVRYAMDQHVDEDLYIGGRTAARILGTLGRKVTQYLEKVEGQILRARTTTALLAVSGNRALLREVDGLIAKELTEVQHELENQGPEMVDRDTDQNGSTQSLTDEPAEA